MVMANVFSKSGNIQIRPKPGSLRENKMRLKWSEIIFHEKHIKNICNM